MSVRYLSCGDTAFTVEFGNEISPEINGKVMALHAEIGRAKATGSLPGVVSVRLDASCPRHEYRVVGGEGAIVFCASGFPREIPGVPPERNLNGISFAVANMSGFAACAREEASDGSIDEIVRLLAVRVPDA